ncbi:YdeI family protein [Rhodococcus jostii]|uniref:YdeI/OmpD-associated family protein n=1 Tax=Rhodococcus jostii TaxID=132919 RepID=UPI00362FBFE9
MCAAELSVEYFSGQAEFREWLGAHHHSSPGIWLKMAKKGSAHSSINYDQALEVALCYGWIDSQVRRVDDDFFVQRFTPRSSRSPWSKRNREFAEKLAEAGLLEPGGAAEVERARADGRWDRAYEGQKAAEIPQDFLDALAKNPEAEAFYATLDSHNRYAVYYRLQDTTRPETRARRIEKFVQQLSERRKFHD